jgi:hypothetical protein
LFICTQVAFGDEMLREISWAQLKQAGQLTHGAIIPADAHTPFEQLQIVSTARQSTTVEVMTVQNPEITSARYAITGKVRYENVAGKAYLEMWSFFPDGTFYASRTLADTGPTQSLEGDSDWRLFSLPFTMDDSPLRPDKLAVNVVFPSAGIVQLGQLRVVQYPDAKLTHLISRNGWALVFGAAGVTGICYCVLAFLASRGRARHLVTRMLVVFVFLGAAALIVGFVALRPGAVPIHPLQLFMLAAVLLAPSAVALARIRKRYEEKELRRMDAMDAASHHG